MAHPHPIDIPVEIEVADVATQLLSYDQIQIHRSTNGEGGTFVEKTTTSTRPRLEAHVVHYRWVDGEGSPDYWYKYRFFNSTTEAEGPFSQALPGMEDPALQVLSIQALKDIYLFGVDLTDDQGKPYPEKLFVHYIASAVAAIENELDIRIVPREVPEERHDWNYGDLADAFYNLNLNLVPVVSVDSVQLVLPGSDPIDIDSSWLHLNRKTGSLDLLPSPVIGMRATPWAVMHRPRLVPGTWRINYVAGFGKPNDNVVSYRDPEVEKVPGDLLDAIGMLASMGPFNIAGDLIAGAGIASKSVSLDGLSQSISTTSSATNAGYGSRIIQYSKQLKEAFPRLRQKYSRGLRLTVV